ncbi:MFS transporter [Amycolatopsis methanolica]|uniref:Major facilitator superfamily protein n=1 Tax=Amycolatopsis methanolica 239 TaxID=1068978 RepID=A0A076MSF7_AMYME|nr:MFS transporter [Amycolatopsis methanolica]AIJ21901.1 major facilitator superfamily protein [Amycolatopsis methanolica 239]
MQNNAVARRSWREGVTRRQWRSLIAANLGWLFDGFETYALILTVGQVLRTLDPSAPQSSIAFLSGATIAVTLLGWGIGGILGGVFADYFGRRRTLLVAIVLYAVFTGLTAASWDLTSFLVLRFVTGFALGSEWGTGASLIAEIWPSHARAKAAGLMQCGLGLGFFIASACWYFVAPVGPQAWRIMFLIGVLPAFFALWLRRSVPESEQWTKANTRRHSLRERRRENLTRDEVSYTRLTLRQIFADPELRKRTILGSLMSLTTTLGWWGISTWVPLYVSGIAADSGRSATTWASAAGMIYNVGAIAGYIGFGFIADRVGRKPATMLYFAASLLLTPVLFLWTHDLGLVVVVLIINGFFTLGQYTWMPVWLPELYPTHLRATGAAFVFNAARFVAFLGPLLAGAIISALGGYGVAATVVGLIYLLGLVVAPFCPETRGTSLAD